MRFDFLRVLLQIGVASVQERTSCRNCEADASAKYGTVLEPVEEASFIGHRSSFDARFMLEEMQDVIDGIPRKSIASDVFKQEVLPCAFQSVTCTHLPSYLKSTWSIGPIDGSMACNTQSLHHRDSDSRTVVGDGCRI